MDFGAALHLDQRNKSAKPLAQELGEEAALSECTAGVGVHRQCHGLLAEVDSIEAQRHGAHLTQLDSKHFPQHVIVAGGDRFGGEDYRVQTDGQAFPRWKTSVDRHGDTGQEAFVGGPAAVDVDGLPGDQHHALCVAEKGDTAHSHRAPVIAEDVQRRLPKLFPALEARAGLLQERLDELDELVFDHDKDPPGSLLTTVRDKLVGKQRSAFMTSEAIPAAKPASASRVTLAIITEPKQANPNNTIHGGVILKLVDECGAIAALRHAGEGQITTAAIDSMTFLGPVYVGERVEISAEVTYVGRSSIETRIEVFAEPIESALKRKVGVGFGLYVALDLKDQRPRQVPPLLIETEADRARQKAAQARQAARLARRAEAVDQ
jgi:uncharacterized protein (TIGR00369 family)